MKVEGEVHINNLQRLKMTLGFRVETMRSRHLGLGFLYMWAAMSSALIPSHQPTRCNGGYFYNRVVLIPCVEEGKVALI